MTEEKGLPEEVADKIGEYVMLKGGRDLLEKLQKDEKLTQNASASQGLEDMALLYDYMDIFGITDKVRTVERRVIMTRLTHANHNVLDVL